ncbi:hypothetical protein Acor_55340 [Acrocarpospora corrugata]|uniref:Phage tail protein n=1 Tax=Acrocarpospora corrugata TaxID=35763 RepID=A0A5M3WAD2_9ACTN|nr:phage tail protein [Acrocarpospora corrugata]GES03468.1 hypothetical protein Acor_55340 [Acrocarpospora corrugata]
MSDKSGYLRHLPPVLWQDEPEPPEFSLGAMLRIFEKVLTGIDDGVPLPKEALARQVAAVPRLFDPRTTPEEMLPWLASWVALRFPTLQGEYHWDVAQRRRVTGQIAGVYRWRGRHGGLTRYLDLYAAGRIRPRVALDTGARLLALTVPRPGVPALVSGLVTQGPVVIGTKVHAEGVTRPWTIATASDGTLFAGDLGLPAASPVGVRGRVWRLDAGGGPDQAGRPPLPAPVALPVQPTRIVAVAVVPARGARPETLYVLDRPGKLYALPAPFRATATEVATLSAAGTAFDPVAMTVDPGNGDLLVLDRGSGAGTANGPKIITVRFDPVATTRTALPAVQEPLSLFAERDGSLLIGDGGPQEPTGPADLPGGLLRVVRAATPWTVTPVLSAPLTAPTGIARGRDGELYVLDVGLKPFAPSTTDPFIGPVSRDACVLRVDPAAGKAVQITERGQFVYPTGMVAVGDRLIVCDPGQPTTPTDVAGHEPYWCRVQPHLFNVVLHFTADRLPEDPDERHRALVQVVGDIRGIVDAQKPAHTIWNLITAV